MRMKAAIATAFTALLGLASCTYGEKRQVIDLEYAISDDGAMVAVSAERHISQSATGIAAFPSGGVSRVTDQMVDVYFVDLASKKILYRHVIDPPGNGAMEALNVWVMGWQGGDAYVKLIGCLPGFWTSYRGCHGERRQEFVYRVSRHGVEPADEPEPPLRRHLYLGGSTGGDARRGERSYLSTRDGVWIHHGNRGTREQLLRINGKDLEEVVD